MGDLVEQDFGKNQRDMARRLNRLLKLVADRDEDLLRDPAKYFKLASDRIIALEKYIDQLTDAARPQVQIIYDPMSNLDALGVNVPNTRYKAMLAIEKLLSSRP